MTTEFWKLLTNFIKKIFNTNHIPSDELSFLKKLNKSNNFKKQPIHKNFWLINLILRNIFFNHLSKFNCVYKKNQRSNSFDILRSKILKKSLLLMSVLIVEIHIFQQELYIVLRIISVELSKQIFLS